MLERTLQICVCQKKKKKSHLKFV